MTELNVNDVKISLQKFGWPDYLVFVLMLVSCSMIGIYFGFYSKKSKATTKKADEYLVGGRNMSVLPIAMSLVAR
jgi:solute carrier family 5 (sodium-coupled monocarboxylate transporter), member 8/12